MQIEKIKEKNKLTMKIIGRLDATTAPTLEQEVNKEIDDVTELVFDFAELEYISSAGLRVLLLILKAMKGKGTFVIKNVNGIVQEVLEVTGFADMLTIE